MKSYLASHVDSILTAVILKNNPQTTVQQLTNNMRLEAIECANSDILPAEYPISADHTARARLQQPLF